MNDRAARATVKHLSVEERAALGREARATTPRASLAAHTPPTRRDPVSVLMEQAITRQQDLLPIRYGRMAASPFAFLRGAAAVMAADLAASPVSGLRVQAIGDAHISNFGVFASPGRRLMFDVNDFDETLPGPWEWDVKRLVASVAVAARGNGAEKAAAKAAARRAAAYRKSMRLLRGRDARCLVRAPRRRGHCPVSSQVDEPPSGREAAAQDPWPQQPAGGGQAR